VLRDVLFALWFFLPAGIANAAPVLAARLPIIRKWNQPIDRGHMYRGKRIFGEHKTWRGIVAGMITATLVLWLQQALVGNLDWAQALTSQVDYLSLPLLVLGPLFGFGALAGDAIESFFKRQRDVPSGHSWFPFDQIDYIIGGALAAAPFVILSLRQYVLLIVLWLFVHLAVSYIGYRFGLKERPI